MAERLQNRKKIIGTVKYPDDFLILGKEETILGGVTGRLLKLEDSMEMEMNMENWRISRYVGRSSSKVS